MAAATSLTGRTWKRIRWVASLAIPFALFAFAYSFIGFLHPQLIHLHEYSIPGAVVELGGHFLFGAFVALPLLEINLALLSGSLAVLMDSDHLLTALNLPVASRPDHSVLFIFAATAFVYGVCRWTRRNPRAALKITSVVPAAILSHFSYDVLASFGIFGGGGYSFPLFTPFSFTLIAMPSYSWIPFELLGVMVTLTAALAVRRMARESARHVERGLQASGNSTLLKAGAVGPAA